MKKIYKLEDLGCANCASKMEEKIKKLPQVNSISINFIASKLVVDIEDDSFDSTMKQIQKIITKFEPDCTIIK